MVHEWDAVPGALPWSAEPPKFLPAVVVRPTLMARVIAMTDIEVIRSRAASSDEIELPFVIRPRILRLADLERQVRVDDALAIALAGRSDFRRLIARAMLVRDRQARARFADTEQLELHLRGLSDLRAG
jgi:hypothetical protein